MKPLQGLRVLDFSRVLAGPFATQILAELGAEVTKVERPRSGDESRSFEPKAPGGESAYFLALNRAKRSITINLKSERGREVARALAGRMDVVVENFLPGEMARHGLDYASLAPANPRLIYVSNTGFGQTGPYRDRNGYDTIFQALSGVMALTGYPDGPPAKVGLPFADLTSALWIAIAILTSLVGRQQTGRGCYVDLAMMDVQTSLLSIAAARLFALDEDPPRVGTEHAGRVPSAAFACRDGSFLHISGSDQHWAATCRVLGLDALAAEPELAENAGRVAARDRVMAAMRTAAAGRDRTDLAEALRAEGVPAGRGEHGARNPERPAYRRARRGERVRPSHGRAFPRPAQPAALRRVRRPGLRHPAAAGRGYGSDPARRVGPGRGGRGSLARGPGDMTADAPVLLRQDGAVARVTLNRSRARNALDLPMCHALRDAFVALDAAADVRVVLLDAAGPVFCAGADLKERQGKDEAWVRARRLAAFAAYETVERCSKPVVAVVDGPVVGSGGEIAMACDFIIASAAASFRFPEPLWGTVGATQRLQRVVGKRRAKELLFTGRTMPAEEALGLGLVARLVADAAAEAEAVAATIAAAPPLAVALTKQAVELGEEVPLATGVRIELAQIERLLADGSWRKGIDQFAQAVRTPGAGEAS